MLLITLLLTYLLTYIVAGENKVEPMSALSAVWLDDRRKLLVMLQIQSVLHWTSWRKMMAEILAVFLHF